MGKTILEIELNETVDTFQLCQYLNNNRDLKSNVVTCNSIRVRFNPEKIADKIVLKIIQQFSKKNPRDRKRNVTHIKQVNNEIEKAA